MAKPINSWIFIKSSIVQGPPTFTGCTAALKCVTEEFWNVDGVVVSTHVRLSPYEKEYLRVPLMVCNSFHDFVTSVYWWRFDFLLECTNPETNQVGFCCRDSFMKTIDKLISRCLKRWTKCKQVRLYRWIELYSQHLLMPFWNPTTSGHQFRHLTTL